MIKAGMRVFAYQVDSDRTDIATITHINQYTHTDAIDYEVLADIGDTYITPFVCPLVIDDDIEKSNFNPQMLKNCTDTSYQCGYEQGRADAIDELSKEMYYCLHCGMGKDKSLEHLINLAEKLKEQK